MSLLTVPARGGRGTALNLRGRPGAVCGMLWLVQLLLSQVMMPC
jgi:hypothetical protein